MLQKSRGKEDWKTTLHLLHRQATEAEYRKRQNIGDTFNLASWRLAPLSPNLKVSTFLPRVQSNN